MKTKKEPDRKSKAAKEAIAAKLAELAAGNVGLLTPDAVVREAKKESSVLHDLFEWDDRKAGHQHRLDQARTLIRSVTVVVKVDRTVISTVAYVRAPDIPPESQGYRATSSVMDDPDLAHSVLVDEFTRAAAALRRARELALVFNMTDEIDAATETVETLKTKVQARVEQRAH